MCIYICIVCMKSTCNGTLKTSVISCFIYLSSYILWQLTYEIVAQNSSGLLYYCKRSSLAPPIFTHHFVSTMLSARFIFNCQFLYRRKGYICIYVYVPEQHKKETSSSTSIIYILISVVFEGYYERVCA